MDRINLNGRDYIAADVHSSDKIGIAITTHNRNDLLKEVISNFEEHMPAIAVKFIIDDGSAQKILTNDFPGWEVVRHDYPQGIVASKNRCLHELMSAGCKHLFLFDDDAYPKKSGWEIPYISSGEGHLSYQFEDITGPHKLGDIREIYNDGRIVGYSGQRGVMLYFSREAIKKAGGFDKVYGRGMFEHPDLAARVYSLGLTRCMFGDVKNSGELIHSLDQHLAVQRSIPDVDRESLDKRNSITYRERMEEFCQTGKWPYLDVDYRIEKTESKSRHFVCMAISGKPDPQRPGVKFDHSGVNVWVDSILKNSPGSKISILTDFKSVSDDPKLGVYCEKVTAPLTEDSLYFQKWALVRNYISENRSLISDIFVTDGTDVILKNNPETVPGVLYVGDEPDVLDSKWMIDNHKSEMCKKMFSSFPKSKLFNAGIAGGDAETLFRLASRITSICQVRSVANRSQIELFDMGLFNLAVRWMESSGVNVVSGPIVNTVFKSLGKLGSKSSWFEHK